MASDNMNRTVVRRGFCRMVADGRDFLVVHRHYDDSTTELLREDRWTYGDVVEYNKFRERGLTPPLNVVET